MKFQIIIVLLAALISLFSVQARPTNSMTRIQEVFRTLMGPKQMASRGKKSVVLTRPNDLDDYRLVYLADPREVLFEDN